MDSPSLSEQFVVRRASIFADSFSREALEAVCAGEDHTQTITALLGQLVEQGIIVSAEQEPDTRYRLSEVIRPNARQQLVASGEESRVYQRLVAFFLMLAEQVLENAFGSDRAVWLNRLEQEHANLRAILAWLVEQGEAERGLNLTFLLQELWFEEHHTAEGREWFARLLSLPQATTPDALRARSLDLAGALALAQDDYVAALSLKQEGLTLVRAIGDEQLLGYSLLHLTHLIGYCQGDYSAARELYQEGLDTFRRIGHEEGFAHALANLAIVAQEVGDYQTARPLAYESLRMYRQSADWNLAHSLLTAAVVAAGLGMAEQAVRLAGANVVHEEAIDISQPRVFRERHERMLDRAYTALANGDRRDVVWNEGRAMSLDQAAEYALEVLSDRPSSTK